MLQVESSSDETHSFMRLSLGGSSEVEVFRDDNTTDTSHGSPSIAGTSCIAVGGEDDYSHG